MTDKRPVHLIVETGNLAGGVRVIGEIANRLVQRGWDVAIWSVNKADSMSWFNLDRRVQWHSFLRTGNVGDYDQLVAVLKKHPGIKVATFWRTAYVVEQAMAEGEGYYLVQDVETSYTSQPVLADMVMGTYGLGLRMLTTSAWVKSQLPETTHVGIGVDNFWEPQKKLKRLGYPLACARRQALKGWRELAETARYLAKLGYPLWTYGLDKALPLTADHNHNVDPITLKPAKKLPMTDSQLRQHYTQASCFVSTSNHEGFSLTPLEAMRCYLPVVMTPADGNMEYAEGGVNCMIANSPREVADMVADVLQNAKLSSELAQAGRKVAERYTWAPVIDRIEAAFLA